MSEPKELTLAELNDLTAKEIMGWTSDPGVYINGDEAIRWEDWRPTTDWRDAGRVMDRMHEMGFSLELSDYSLCWVAAYNQRYGENGATAPESIVLSALFAVTGELYCAKEE